jgi:hypothetical protein
MQPLSALAFDTLAYARRMEAVGFSREQAEALAEEQAKLIDDRLATKLDLEALRLATKSDLEALRLATKSDLEALRLATKTDLETLRLAAKSDLDAARNSLEKSIAESKAETLKWIVGTIGLQTVVILGAALALARMAAH